MKNTEKTHLLCIDLESWIFSKRINSKKLSIKELQALDNNYTIIALNNILKLLKKYNQKLTFFLVFKLEEIYPGIIEKILADGHEIAWHTYSHQHVADSETLKRELDNSLKLLKKYKVKGFQAPQVIFLKDGYKILKEYGFVYSSSIYGNSNILYNFDGIYEIPVSVANTSYAPSQAEVLFPSHLSPSNLFKFGIPYGSSLFWGVLGKGYYTNKMHQQQNKGRMVNTFIHEWQLVTPQSKEYRKDVSPLSSFPFSLFFLPYRINVYSLFETLLSEFRFGRCIDYINQKKT